MEIKELQLEGSLKKPSNSIPMSTNKKYQVGAEQVAVAPVERCQSRHHSHLCGAVGHACLPEQDLR